MPTIDIFRNEPKLLDLDAGAVVFNRGDAAHEMYAVVEGSVEIRKGDRVVATLGPGEVFGEMALIDSEPRCATAAALTNCKLAVINESRFSLLVNGTPFFALQMMRVITSRLRRTDES